VEERLGGNLRKTLRIRFRSEQTLAKEKEETVSKEITLKGEQGGKRDGVFFLGKYGKKKMWG